MIPSEKRFTRDTENRKNEVKTVMTGYSGRKTFSDGADVFGGAPVYSMRTAVMAVLAVAFALCMVFPGLAMADSAGPNGPSTGTNNSSVGSRAWSNPGNIWASDNSDASASLSGSQISNYLVATVFNFSIPSNATINGIKVDIERAEGGRSSSAYIRDYSIKIVKNGLITGSERANTGTNWPTSDTFASYGSSTDLWGETWTAADINSGNFGVAVSARNTSSSNTENATVDFIRITIYYTPAPACTLSAPAVSITPSSQTITTNGGSVNYSVTVVNNDSGSGCGNVTYTLGAADSNATAFNASTLNPTAVTVAPGATSAAVTLTVSAKSGQTSGTNTTTVTASASGHANGSAGATTTLNVSAPPPPPPPPTGGLIHNSTNTGSAKWAAQGGWGIAGGKYGEFVCGTCHKDDTTNIKRVKTQITAPDASKGSFPGSAVNFQSTTGPNGFGDDTGGHATSTKICQVCHSATKYHNYNSANNTGGNGHNNATDCMGCHPHREAFRPSESSGGSDCASCHAEIFNPMNGSTSTYHHVMTSAEATYPVKAVLTDTDKRCLQCHADHDIFRSDLNPGNTIGRAANLRVDATVAPSAGAPGATYTNTDFVAAATNGGICTSCHMNVQTRNTTKQKNNGTTSTAVVTKADYSGSAHTYAVPSTFSKDGSVFNADCSKCHNAKNGETVSFQSSANKFATHDSVSSRLLSALGGAAAENPEESFCYKCHATSGDYYGVKTMSAAAKGIQAVFGKTYRHDVAAYSGKHKASPADETRAYLSANKHVECEDCHNPHAASAANPTRGARGVDPANSASNWTAPTGFTEVSVAGGVDEYKICFRCHSSYNTSLTTWNATWTDAGKEFSTSNRSYHWVEGDKGAPKASTTYGNFNIGTATVKDAKNTDWTLNNYAYKMMPRYNGYTNAQLRTVAMRCSDCHGSDNAENNPNGPHGSVNPRILKVPAGSPFTRWDNTVTIQNRGQVWCFNCHDPSFTNSGFRGGDGELHVNKHNKSEAKCMSCHIKIPHGWQIQHLLKPYNMAANYPADNARYNGTGTSSGIDLPLNSTNWNLSGNWTENSCGSHQNCN